MKKPFLAIAIFFAAYTLSAQNFGTINKILDRLEERRGINQNFDSINLDGKKFYNSKDFEDHTERMHLSIVGKKATFVEVFDDKSTGQTSSNIFSGDVIRTKDNILSFRFDLLEGQKIAFPMAKTLLLTKQKNVLYLIDINTKERWIDEIALNQ